MFRQKTSTGNPARARRVRLAISALLGSAVGLGIMWAAYAAPHRPPCRRGEILNKRTGMCYSPCDPNTISGRSGTSCGQ